MMNIQIQCVHSSKNTFPLKAYSTPKLQFCHLSLTPMSFQTRKDFVRLQNTIEDIWDENREACDCLFPF